MKDLKGELRLLPQKKKQQCLLARRALGITSRSKEGSVTFENLGASEFSKYTNFPHFYSHFQLFPINKQKKPGKTMIH